MKRAMTAAIVVLSLSGFSTAQGTKADYERMRALRSLTRDKITHLTLQPNWSEDGKWLWYRNQLPGGESEFISVDLAKAKRGPAFEHGKLATALSMAAGKPVNAARLPFTAIVMVGDGAIHFDAFEKSWRFDPSTVAVAEAKKPAVRALPPMPQRRFGDRRERPNNSGASPDGKWRVIVRDNNLVLRSADDKETLLTKDGTADDYYTPNVFWSPDSTRVVAMRTTRGDERKVTLVESAPRDQLQPKLHTLTYPKPGDKLNVSWPHLIDVVERKEIAIARDLFNDPWSNDRVRWSPDSSEFSFLHNRRGHQLLRYIGINAKSGAARTIIDEVSKTFVDYAHKTFLHEVPGTGEIVWMSERDGWCHLYLIDRQSGAVKNQITRGDWVVRGIDRVDDEKREIWFRAGGIVPGQDPYYVHFCRIKFDGTGFVRLTDGDGTHAISMSPNREYYVDSYSRVDMAPVHELRRSSDGKLVCRLESADMTRLLSTGWKTPERFVTKDRNGKHDIFGVIYRPTSFDPARKYPVIESIYAGPHGAHVPKGFVPVMSGQELAELGFIVVQIDGLGTSYRCKEFHDVCFKNIGDSGFPDRIAWMKAAAAKYPWMDLTRVGIHGGSAGGQSALRALLAHGDFYKVAVSVCGCHDNRMDKVWWNELWMSYPVGPHYADQSNVTQAHRLTGKLLLIVGELDRNVDPASTMQVVNALIKADKDFDLLVVPGGGHGIGGPYGVRRQNDFFVRHLLGVEPRRE